MAWYIDGLVKRAHQNQRAIPGSGGRELWVPARPAADPFLWRVMDAWRVLTGKADAVLWDEREEL